MPPSRLDFQHGGRTLSRGDSFVTTTLHHHMTPSEDLPNSSAENPKVGASKHAESERLGQRKWILEYVRKGSVGAQIGVFRGHFSKILCSVLKPKQLYLVDPWTKVGDSYGMAEKSPKTDSGQLTPANAKAEALSRIEQFKKTAIHVVEDFAGPFLTGLTEKLDWVYLDASRPYSETLEELKLIDTVLAPQGFILGDNWQPKREHKNHGTFLAIHEFIRTRSYEVVAAGPAGQWCLRRVPALPLTVNKSVASGVVHQALDQLKLPLEQGGSFNISGVVVTDEPVNRGLRVTHSRDAADAGTVEWGLRSDGMASKFPGAGNCQASRFIIRDVKIRAGDSLEIHLEGKGGKPQLLWTIHPAERP